MTKKGKGKLIRQKDHCAAWLTYLLRHLSQNPVKFQVHGGWRCQRDISLATFSYQALTIIH